jgi:hypothetical protein
MDTAQSQTKSGWTILALAFSIVLFSGCVIIPHAPKEMPPSSKIDEWIGLTKEEIVGKLGNPEYKFTYDKQNYLIYSSPAKTTFAGLYPIPIYPFGVPAVFSWEDSFSFVLVFNETGRLERFNSGRSISTLGDKQERDAMNEALWEQARSGDPNAAKALEGLFAVSESEIAWAQQLGERARQGDLNAAVVLARYFDDRKTLETLASTNAEAAEIFHSLDRSYPQDVSTADVKRGEASVRTQIEEAESKYQRYWSTASSDKSAALEWLCEAADNGHVGARRLLGAFYQSGTGGLPYDMAQAYLWHNLAAHAGSVDAQTVLKSLALDMKPAELIRGESLLRTWNPGQCKNAIPRL